LITVDDSSSVKLWDLTTSNLIAEETNISKGLLATCALDPIEGKFFACAGMDAKVHIFQFNTEIKKKRKANDPSIKLMIKKCELSGH